MIVYCLTICPLNNCTFLSSKYIKSRYNRDFMYTYLNDLKLYSTSVETVSLKEIEDKNSVSSYLVNEKY